MPGHKSGQGTLTDCPGSDPASGSNHDSASLAPGLTIVLLMSNLIPVFSSSLSEDNAEKFEYEETGPGVSVSSTVERTMNRGGID